MHILVGLLLATALLYFWLIGHWFARVLVFLLLGAAGFVIGAISGHDAPASIIFGVAGVAIAWYVAALPTWYWRHKIEQMLAR